MRKWIENINRRDLGRKFNIQGKYELGDPAVWPRRERTIQEGLEQYMQAGIVGIYATSDEPVKIVPALQIAA
ncbi:MAG: hypothetical protein IT558_01705 [Alphaproteobacteria bacterium]|nr:hypothetical protein [Alphaproteobacteria bacterium]